MIKGRFREMVIESNNGNISGYIAVEKQPQTGFSEILKKDNTETLLAGRMLER
jgi:hypothetical protein